MTADSNGDYLPVGLDEIPSCWSVLTQLTCLELRGHPALSQLPGFLPSLPLQRLDLSCCQRLDVAPVTALTGLTMLALHVGPLPPLPLSLSPFLLPLGR